MSRITQSMLDFKIQALNDISKCRYSIGSSYGYYNLEKHSMECTGISMISQGNTKKELYYQLCVYFDILHAEKKAKADYVKNCTHLDVFNIHGMKEGEKRNMSHIREYNGKFSCLTCQKQVKEAEFILSNVPRTRAELRALRYEK